MIHAVLIFNTHGTARLTKFYTPTAANTRAALPRRIFELVSSRPAGLCNFLDASGLLTDTGTNRTGDLQAGGGGWEWEGEERELQRARVVYRLYATLYFVFVVDGAESELGVLDLIQVFVESLDRAFENVCELDLVFHFDEVHHILAELVQGGLVLETNVEEITRAGEWLFASSAITVFLGPTVHTRMDRAAPRGLAITATRTITLAAGRADESLDGEAPLAPLWVSWLCVSIGFGWRLRMPWR